MNPVTSEQQQPVIVDENRHFSTDHLQGDLAGRSARGGVVTMTAQGFKFVFSTVATIVLARLLTPEDYGLIGMVAILINFVGMFQYLGLSTATVKWSELSHKQVSTLFWVNMFLSVTITTCCGGMGRSIGSFFRPKMPALSRKVESGSIAMKRLFLAFESSSAVVA